MATSAHELIAQPSIAQLTIEQLRLSAGVLAPNTIRAYSHDWQTWNAWCELHDRRPLPASAADVALYLTERLNRGRRVSSAVRWITSISYYHRRADLPSPSANGELARLLTGAQRLRKEQPKQKLPVGLDHLRRICSTPVAGIAATRDRSILLFGFATALRRCNLVRLDVADLEWKDPGVIVHVRYSKTDQKGVGFSLGIPRGVGNTCPVQALQAWLALRVEVPGALFLPVHCGRLRLGRMSAHRISLVVKAQMQSVGVAPAEVGAHSMRAGHVTEALAKGVDHLVIMRTTGHRSVQSVEKYFREPDPFRSNSAGQLGL